MPFSEQAKQVCKNAWNWDIYEFARRLGKDSSNPMGDVWILEKWRAFRALSDALNGLGPEVLDLISKA